jgi:tRNA pseudouridine32 synthase/23S rRNA pseudouridine746 synthase
MTPEEMLSRLLYRDGMMLVVDKPAGLSVHRGPKGGASLEDYFDVLRFGLPRMPALAHRLDKDTSGCLVLGRHRKALALLGKLFKNGAIGKTYWAVVEGGPTEDEGRIDIPLGKLDEDRGWWMKPDPDGKPSSTTWKVMGRSFFSPPPCGEGSGVGVDANEIRTTPLPNLPPQGGREHANTGGSSHEKHFTWLALEPLTGRTHQLRVHCAEMGFPILGDPIYGSAPRNSVSLGGPALHLHSREIVVPISKNKPPVTTIAPVPVHMREVLTKCGWTEAIEPRSAGET